MSLLEQTEREMALTEEIAHKFDIKGAEKSGNESGVSGNGEIAGIAGIAVGEPELLRRPVPPPKAYPVDSLGDILGPAADRIHSVVQAPLALCGQSILAAASLATQAHADVLIDGRRELLSLWALSIAVSGDRKSSADRLALEAHREHERGALENYAQKETLFKAELAAHKSASIMASKGKDQDVIKKALVSLGPEPEPPLNPLLFIGTPTIEGIHRLYKDGLPSIGVFHDDAGEFIGGHAMNKDNRAKSVAGMSRLWDCGEFDRVRGGDGAAKYFGRRFAMHLMIQPVIAETVLSDDLLTGQGFLARTLLAWPETMIGGRRYVEVDISKDRDLASYRTRIKELLTIPQQLKNRNELEPRSLTLSPGAKSRWMSIHNAIEGDMKEDGDYSSVRPWASKAPAQCLRIAAVLTLISNSDAGVINTEAIDQAASLVMFSLSEAVRIVGTSAIPIEIRHAEALLAWCHGSGRTLLYSTAALQFGPGAIRTRRAFDAAVSELERSGWAVPIKGGYEVDEVHRRRVWAIRGQSDE